MTDDHEDEEFVLEEDPSAPTGLLLADLPLLFRKRGLLGDYRRAVWGFLAALVFVLFILVLTIWLARLGA